MPNYNKLILMGHLVKDIDIKQSQSGLSIGKSTLAVNSKYKGNEKTMFIDFTAFGKTAEVAEQYLSKGDAVMLEGELQLDKWQDKNGNNRSKHTMLVNKLVFLGNKKLASPQMEKSEQQPDSDLPF